MPMNNILKYLPLAIIIFYKRAISPFLLPRCRFYPSCSSYFYEAFMKKGFLLGMKLSSIRLCKCHPFNEGGFDPVPHDDN